MRNLGADASVLVNERNFAALRRAYSRFRWVDEACHSFGGPKELAERISDADYVIATTNTSVHSIAEATRLTKHVFQPAYYVQDYEPLFYTVGSEDWNIAVASFSLLRGCKYIAKTRWLCQIVRTIHGHDVARVTPSIDHSVYNTISKRNNTGRKTVCAMVRPSTPRRATGRTMRILARLAEKYGANTDFVTFGATRAELQEHNIPCYDGVEIQGVLSQSGVATLLQQSDFFLDLSDYQAFGRTAAEAMACGTVALAPALGGAVDFVQHGYNSYLVNTTDEGAVYATIERMLAMTEDEMRQVRIAGIESVAGYTPEAAAISEFRALGMI